MSSKTVYLPFYIVLTDPDVVKQWQAKYPKGVNRAPYNPVGGPNGGPGGAAIEFAAPWVGVSDTGKTAPYTYAPSAAHVGGSQYPTNVATFTQKSGGFFGLFGTTTTFYWLGQFVLAGAQSDTVGGNVVVPENLQVRRWVEGWECGEGGPGGSAASGGGLTIARSASRHIGGWGLAYTGTNTACSIALTKYTTGLPASPTSWERFYVRLRRAPSLTSFPGIWRCRGSNSPASGANLAIAPNGDVYLFNVDSVSSRTFQAIIGTLPVWNGHVDSDAWVRIDLTVQYNGALAGGKLGVWWNGKHVGDFAGISGTGLASAGAGHTSSEIGSSFGQNDAEYDVDDWTNATIPALFTGRDWLNGSKIVRVKPAAFSGSNVWAGAVQTLLQFVRATFNGALLTSAVSGALLETTCDDAIQLDADGTILGVTALGVVIESAAVGLAGSLGYKLNAAAAVDTVLTESSSHAFKSVLYTNPGTANTFPDITPIKLRYTKGADTNTSSVRGICAQAEAIGVFGTADVRVSEVAGATPPTFPGDVGVHNAPYPRSPWATEGKAGSTAPYVIVGGTYVGNGTGQDITFRCPVHFFHVRNVATGATFQWWSSMAGPHPAWNEQVDPSIADACEDLTFAPVQAPDNQQNRYIMRIAGSAGGLNTAAATYQYIAICDPGARYMLNGAMTHLNTFPATIDNPLIDPGYTPEFAFLIAETDGATTTQRMYSQGPANTPGTVQNVSGGATASALVMSQGNLQTLTNLHVQMGGSAFSYMLWRRHDGNNDPGEPGVVAFASWTGVGGASRTINLAPASGKRPLFAIVFGQGGAACWRDPSHTGTNSSNSAGTTVTTGITAGGIDQISVGSSLDTNGIIFNAIVWFADATAGNGGFGVNGEFAPVEAAPPADGPFPAPPDINDVLAQDGTTGGDTGGGTIGTPTIPGDIATDLAAACLPFSTAVCNLALSRIGVSKQIVSLATDNTLEAAVMRLHYGIDVEQTLRDWPWPFATRYADLVLVAGTALVPVNGDWQYAYRAPDGMLLARRIVGQQEQKRDYDETPIKFRVGSDDTGDLIYTDAAEDEVPVTLEYTVRLACPASAKDPLFRSLLAWRLAASGAPALSRDPQRATFCLQMYENQKIAATATSASEQQQAPDGDPDWITGRG